MYFGSGALFMLCFDLNMWLYALKYWKSSHDLSFNNSRSFTKFVTTVQYAGTSIVCLLPFLYFLFYTIA